MAFRRSRKRKITVGERKQVEQLLRHLGMIAEHADEGIVVVDLKGTLHFVNTAWAKMHGYKTSSELVGKQISMFHTKEQMKMDVVPLIEQTKRSGQFMGPVEHVRSDGTTFPTKTKMTTLKDNESKVSGLTVLITDITEGEQAEKHLEQQVAELTDANEQLKQQIAEHEQGDEGLKQQVAELTDANEQLKQQIAEREQGDEGLKQQVAELTDANEQLQQQIAERRQADENLKQQVAELTDANEQLQQQIAGRGQAEENLEQQVAELTDANEQLQQQIAERKQLEEALRENNKQTKELKEQIEQIQRQISQHEQDEEILEEITGEAEQPRHLSEPLDAQKLKAIADLAKRLE
ncbi:MAG: PAS domain-containing protein [Planctomycetota bacterium]